MTASRQNSRFWGMHLAAATARDKIRLRSHQAKRRILDMLVTKKMLIVLTLVGALVGAGIGSLITHSASSTSAANTTAPRTSYDNNAQTTTTTSSDRTPDQIAAENSSQFSTTQEQTAYRQGFDQGYSTCSTAVNNQNRTTTGAYPASYTASTSRTSGRRYYSSRRSYYDYSSAPRGRTFWQKHRDKLTVAMGTGGGALLGGLIGGKRGAGIGALAGAGGSALYTYKLRKRSRRY
jgi:hypothetical protein